MTNKLKCLGFLLSLAFFFMHGRVEAQTATLPETIAPVGEIEVVGEGYSFTEGPAWDPKRNWLLFTDIPNTAIHVVDKEGSVEPFTKESGHANGLLVASDGRLLACEMDGRLVAYNLTTGKRDVLADTFEGKPFNAPNDLIIDKQGGIYFTDPLFRAATPLPQTVQAVYYRAKDATVTRVSGDIAAPNGIALSPDGTKLYVAPSHQAEMLVFAVEGPGKLSAAKTFCRLTQPEGEDNTGGDGMTVDVKGNLYFTTHLGVEIFSPSGDSIGLVRFPQQPANVTFAGKDRKTMVATARTAVYQVEMPIAGLAPN
ncbi:Gluconolactonase precursor [Rubripirellula amarantea]|uniref:Gluconolactonase n=1 Tax=Rubripirellula amarantea TaxID=2527999 RepID=A0A5C5WPN6_9BACT|nr:SMP-30/gluconolactonase/LRE family protein [Rubripirellula amarantea]TWT52390.1 Gluconolactonase precursor [Rubripirellula amarantea]